MTSPQIKILPDGPSLAREAADRVVRWAKQFIDEHHRFSIALSGGSTPKALYQILATPQVASEIDWPKVEVFFGDERCVPPEHAESNYRMAREALLGKVPIPGDNIYRMRGEIEPEEAAKEYGLMLKEKFGDGGIDLMLLGLGEDGHTASLFPHTPALHETKHRCVAQLVEHSTTGRSWRLTLTPPFINQCRQILVLVSGENKACAMHEVLEGPRDPDRLPMQLIEPVTGEVVWLADAAAAGMSED
jgi:6-phosphogluconolactonase